MLYRLLYTRTSTFDAASTFVQLNPQRPLNPTYEQVPKPDWQPVPQWPVVAPHHEYCEQQFPYDDPLQVKPEVPAQVPSVETFLAAAEVAAALVEVALVEVAGFTVLVAALVGTAPLLPQLPKPAWQPVPQWSVV